VRAAKVQDAQAGLDQPLDQGADAGLVPALDGVHMPETFAVGVLGAGGDRLVVGLAPQQRAQPPVGHRRGLAQQVTEAGGDQRHRSRPQGGQIGEDGLRRLGVHRDLHPAQDERRAVRRVAIDRGRGGQREEGIARAVAGEADDVRDRPRADRDVRLWPGRRPHQDAHAGGLVGDHLLPLQQDRRRSIALPAQRLLNALPQRGIGVAVGDQHQILQAALPAVGQQFGDRLVAHIDRRDSCHGLPFPVPVTSARTDR